MTRRSHYLLAAAGTLATVGVINLAAATAAPAPRATNTRLTPTNVRFVPPSITKPTIPGPCWPVPGQDLFCGTYEQYVDYLDLHNLQVPTQTQVQVNPNLFRR